MILLCTWNENSRQLTLEFDAEALGIAPLRVNDVMNDESVEIDGGVFVLNMPGYATRILRSE
jgi:hypothetical protein